MIKLVSTELSLSVPVTLLLVPPSSLSDSSESDSEPEILDISPVKWWHENQLAVNVDCPITFHAKLKARFVGLWFPHQLRFSSQTPPLWRVAIPSSFVSGWSDASRACSVPSEILTTHACVYSLHYIDWAFRWSEKRRVWSYLFLTVNEGAFASWADHLVRHIFNQAALPPSIILWAFIFQPGV